MAHTRRPLDPSVRWLRRGLLGYRRRDVHAILELQRQQLDALAASVQRLWSEKRALGDELVKARGAFEVRLGRERLRTEEAEARARIRAAQILAEAEEHATRLRHGASLRVGDAAARLEGVLEVREQLLGELRGVLHAYGDLLEQAEHGQAPSRRAEAPAAPTRVAAPAGAPDQAGEPGLSARRVELDAGPFNDFAELAAFERSLAGLPKVQDVHIASFGDERARIELTLSEERPLARDLVGLPYDVRISGGDDDRLTVDVAPTAASA